MPSKNQSGSPKHPLAEPIRGSEIGSFAEYTLSTRLPDNARRVLKDNAWHPEIASLLQALADEMPNGRLRLLTDHGAPDAEDWAGYIEPYQGQTWLEPPWFLAETYFYRRILEATGYYQPGPGHRIDPYYPQKHQELKTVLRNLESLNSQMGIYKEGLPSGTDGRELMLTHLLRTSIWGNQADLSLWPSGEKEKPDNYKLPENILIDNAPEVSHFMVNLKSPIRVDLILDNSGVELAYDLVLADFLLTNLLASSIVFHTKTHPTFVSDATTDDVFQLVNFLSSVNNPSSQVLATHLKNYLNTRKLVLQDNTYWTSPLSGWEMPEELHQELSQSCLIISKGDANYRRWLGDRHWSFTAPSLDVMGYFPAPMVALRVLKSNTLVGLSPGQPDAAENQDPEWLYSGKWGIIQFVKP